MSFTNFFVRMLVAVTIAAFTVPVSAARSQNANLPEQVNVLTTTPSSSCSQETTETREPQTLAQQKATCGVTQCISGCERIYDNCMKRGGSIINCAVQRDKCIHNCTDNCK
jgi:hypothetical protein